SRRRRSPRSPGPPSRAPGVPGCRWPRPRRRSSPRRRRASPGPPRGGALRKSIRRSSTQPTFVRYPVPHTLVRMSAVFDSPLLDAARRRVLIGDGAMGTMLQAIDLDVDADFLGLEGCNEILNDSRPDVVEGIHRAFFEAGADAVETNTFGCNLSNLGDYDIVDRITELAE